MSPSSTPRWRLDTSFRHRCSIEEESHLLHIADRRRRLLLIANPAARQVTPRLPEVIESILSQGYEVETLLSSSAEHARVVASTAADEGFALVAAMGGDGLVSHVMSGVVGSGAGLAIIPAGTTNAAARSLGVGADAEAAARALVTAPSVRAVAVARVTLSGQGGTETLHALSQLGIGFDADVVQRAERNQNRKRSLGELHLASSALAVCSSWPAERNGTLWVESESRSCRASTVSVQIRWPYTFFGPLPVAFTPRPTTGLDVLVVRRVSPAVFMRTVRRSMTTHDFAGCPGIELWPGCLRLVVRADPAMVVQADGEPLGVFERIEVTWSLGDLLLVNPG